MGINKSLLFFLIFTSVLSLKAQTVKCDAPFAAFEANVKSGKYDDALLQLKDLMKECPKHSDRLYTSGEYILNYKIEAAGTDEERKEYIDSILFLYSQFDKNFPSNTNSNDVKKALLLNTYKVVPEDEVFKLLDASFAVKRQGFTNYEALELYYNLYLKRFEAGNKGIAEKDFIEKYSELTAQAAFARREVAVRRKELLVKQETQVLADEEKQFLEITKHDASAFKAVGENIEGQSSKYFSCEKLEAFYAGQHEKHKDDVAWLEAMVNTLIYNKCWNSELLSKGAVSLYELMPNPETAFVAGTVARNKNDMKEAAKYFDIAAGLEKDTEEKADIYMKIAVIYRNMDKLQAKAYAVKAAQTDAKSGKPYIFLAELYSSLIPSECQLSDFERNALLWLAIETVKKAGVAEAKYKPTADALIEGYKKRLPVKADVKAAGKRKGDQITYGCWINETVTVPNI